MPAIINSVTGGLVDVEAMAQRFGLWEKLRLNRCLDVRKDRSRGYSAEVIRRANYLRVVFRRHGRGGCRAAQ